MSTTSFFHPKQELPHSKTLNHHCDEKLHVNLSRPVPPHLDCRNANFRSAQPENRLLRCKYSRTDLDAPLVHVYDGVQVHPSQIHRVKERHLTHILPADHKTLDTLQSKRHPLKPTLAVFYAYTAFWYPWCAIWKICLLRDRQRPLALYRVRAHTKGSHTFCRLVLLTCQVLLDTSFTMRTVCNLLEVLFVRLPVLWVT